MRAIVIGLVGLLVVGGSATVGQQPTDPLRGARQRKVVKTDREWQRVLTREQYFVTRQKQTEAPFTGKLVNNHAKGYYACVCCGSFLFSSRTKFESGTGWPSFWAPVDRAKVETAVDYELTEPRVEVLCADCGAHLGHVFNDGPDPTGLRYCMNSAALRFLTEAQAKARLDKEKRDEEKARAAEKPGSKAVDKAADKPAPKPAAPGPEAPG